MTDKDALACLKWKIKKVPYSFGTPLKEKLDFFFSANMFNEICWKNMKNLKIYGEKQVAIINSYLKNTANVLIIEPGLPIGGKLVSIFRKSFLQKGFSIIAPCPHINSCPLHERQMEGEKWQVSARGKWCHFSFSTLNAPNTLLEFSKQVHLAKKTASLSYLYCRKDINGAHAKTKPLIKNEVRSKKQNNVSAIVTSNIIKLQDEKIGVYACSACGFLLLQTEKKNQARKMKSGTYISIDTKNINHSIRDKKSGATIVELDSK